MAMIKYSTGPLNNLAFSNRIVSKNIIINAAHRGRDDQEKVHVKVFALNGRRRLIASLSFVVGPLSSAIKIIDVSKAKAYEVQFSSNDRDILFAVFGISPKNKYVAAHRVVHSELTRI
ncbi:hypothetical protein [Paenibacillus sp. Soil787]|uniref:hypothetical protein n=1 Tax=Paenibacillus sp. Soil787 TaxID=1736411 RepID=UPI000702F6C5|nr:hypothetical protein [Paenibacillus sp. Soil787]KRF21563.1 hypothetical protein ASG93_09390 [Paenibacillus sp. Soil787]